MNYLTVIYPQTASILLNGGVFPYIQQVFLSSGNILLPSLTSVNGFTNNHLVSALFPAFSGYQLPASYYNIEGKNNLNINLPSFSVNGTADIILYNIAGYTKLSDIGYLIQYTNC